MTEVCWLHFSAKCHSCDSDQWSLQFARDVAAYEASGAPVAEYGSDDGAPEAAPVAAPAIAG